jgi:hypothetical protein
MGYMRRDLKSHLTAKANNNKAGEVANPLPLLVQSSLKGVMTCSLPKSAGLSMASFSTWMLAALATFEVVNFMEGFIWLHVPAKEQKGTHHYLRFITNALLNADNGVQAHSGHKIIATEWIQAAQAMPVILEAAEEAGVDLSVPAPAEAPAAPRGRQRGMAARLRDANPAPQV